MTIIITDFWWLIPTLATLGAWVWVFSFNYSGSYNFTGMFTVPVGLFVTSLAWGAYFAVLYFTR